MSTEDDIIAALKNVGVDTTCGACMEVAFTGVTTNAHTCIDRETGKPVIGSGNQLANDHSDTARSGEAP